MPTIVVHTAHWMTNSNSLLCVVGTKNVFSFQFHSQTVPDYVGTKCTCANPMLLYAVENENRMLGERHSGTQEWWSYCLSSIALWIRLCMHTYLQFTFSGFLPLSYILNTISSISSMEPLYNLKVYIEAHIVVRVTHDIRLLRALPWSWWCVTVFKNR